MKCPLCDRSVRQIAKSFTYKRNGKSLTMSNKYWECAWGCQAFDEPGVFRFIDAELWRENDKQAALAWQKTYGEPIPKLKPVKFIKRKK